MVEWKKLGEVCEIKTGRGITQKDCSEDGQYPVISGGQTPMGMYHQYNRESKTVTISRVGAYAGYVSFINERFYLNDKCFSIIPFDNSVLNNKYLYSVLKGQEEIIQKLQSEGGVPTINTKKVGALSIPIPSLSEQQRIVSILDTFTSSISNLKQQIEERRKQYEYERDLLLDLEGKEGVERIPLKEVCDVINGRAYSQPELLDKGKYRVLRVGNFFSNDNWYYSDLELEDKYYCKNGDLLYTWSASFGPHIWKEERVIYHYHIWKMECKDRLHIKYMYYWLQSKDMYKQAFSNLHGATMAHLTKALMESLKVSLPPLSTQSRIVSILDTFEQSISNLEEQMAMREKQYEYYRNQLLTFEGEEERGKT